MVTCLFGLVQEVFDWGPKNVVGDGGGRGDQAKRGQEVYGRWELGVHNIDQCFNMLF